MSKLIITTWKTKHDNKETPINEMSNEDIQRALLVVQKRQLASLHKLKIDRALEETLQKEAKSRKVTLIDLDLADNPRYSKEYAKKKEVIITVRRSMDRKEKQLANEAV